MGPHESVCLPAALGPVAVSSLSSDSVNLQYDTYRVSDTFYLTIKRDMSSSRVTCMFDNMGSPSPCYAAPPNASRIATLCERYGSKSRYAALSALAANGALESASAVHSTLPNGGVCHGQLDAKQLLSSLSQTEREALDAVRTIYLEAGGVLDDMSEPFLMRFLAAHKWWRCS